MDKTDKQVEAELKELLASVNEENHESPANNSNNTNSAASGISHNNSTNNNNEDDLDLDSLYENLQMALQSEDMHDESTGNQGQYDQDIPEDTDDATLERLLQTFLTAENSKEGEPSSAAATTTTTKTSKAKRSGRQSKQQRSQQQQSQRQNKAQSRAQSQTQIPTQGQNLSQSQVQQTERSAEPGLSIAETLARTRSTMRKEPTSKIDPMLNRRAIFQPSQYSAAAARNARPTAATTARPSKQQSQTRFQVYTPPKNTDSKRPEPLKVSDSAAAAASRSSNTSSANTSKKRKKKDQEDDMSLISYLARVAGTEMSEPDHDESLELGGKQQDQSREIGQITSALQNQAQTSNSLNSTVPHEEQNDGLSSEAIDMLSAAIQEWSKSTQEENNKTKSRVIAKVKRFRNAATTPEEKERIRTENRERKQKWRTQHAERNKDNDLKSRVLKRANKMFGHGDTPEKSEWVSSQIEQRRLKRRNKELNQAIRVGTTAAGPGGDSSSGPVIKSDETQESLKAIIDDMSNSTDLSEALSLLVRNKHLLHHFIEEDDSAGGITTDEPHDRNEEPHAKRHAPSRHNNEGSSSENANENDNDNDQNDDSDIHELAGLLQQAVGDDGNEGAANTATKTSNSTTVKPVSQKSAPSTVTPTQPPPLTTKKHLQPPPAVIAPQPPAVVIKKQPSSPGSSPSSSNTTRQNTPRVGPGPPPFIAKPANSNNSNNPPVKSLGFPPLLTSVKR